MINLLPFSLVIHRAPDFISHSLLFHKTFDNIFELAVSLPIYATALSSDYFLIIMKSFPLRTP